MPPHRRVNKLLLPRTRRSHGSTKDLDLLVVEALEGEHLDAATVTAPAGALRRTMPGLRHHIHRRRSTTRGRPPAPAVTRIPGKSLEQQQQHGRDHKNRTFLRTKERLRLLDRRKTNGDCAK